jgi:hypothetical protein
MAVMSVPNPSDLKVKSWRRVSSPLLAGTSDSNVRPARAESFLDADRDGIEGESGGQAGGEEIERRYAGRAQVARELASGFDERGRPDFIGL